VACSLSQCRCRRPAQIIHPRPAAISVVKSRKNRPLGAALNQRGKPEGGAQRLARIQYFCCSLQVSDLRVRPPRAIGPARSSGNLETLEPQPEPIVDQRALTAVIASFSMRSLASFDISLASRSQCLFRARRTRSESEPSASSGHRIPSVDFMSQVDSEAASGARNHEQWPVQGRGLLARSQRKEPLASGVYSQNLAKNSRFARKVAICRGLA